MAILRVLNYPHPALKVVAQPVEEIDDNIRRIVSDMFETMYVRDGVGLAATQVNVPHRIITIDMSPHDRSEPLCLINPVITDSMGEQLEEEACLSFPGVWAKVKRARSIAVEALNEQGTPFTLEAKGRQAIAIQHEIDHLDGIVFIDKLSALKRDFVLRKYKKHLRLIQKHNATR